jgi:DHA3 family macrolide efflux protein-like MFS transporter
MMAGAGVTGILGKKITNKIALSMFGLFLFSITMFLLGILPPTQIGFWLCIGVCVVMGAANNVYNIPYMTYMQETISPEKQGRAFSLLNCLMSLAMPLGLLIAGPVAETWRMIGGGGIVLLYGSWWNKFSGNFRLYSDDKEKYRNGAVKPIAAVRMVIDLAFAVL